MRPKPLIATRTVIAEVVLLVEKLAGRFCG
jgi:hypothetical protein